MAERMNRHKYSIIGINIRRLREECSMKATDVIEKMQLEDINMN